MYGTAAVPFMGSSFWLFGALIMNWFFSNVILRTAVSLQSASIYSCTEVTGRSFMELLLLHLSQSFYASPTSLLPCILIQSSRHSVHRNVDSNNHVITYASDRHLGLVDKGIIRRFRFVCVSVRALTHPRVHACIPGILIQGKQQCFAVHIGMLKIVTTEALDWIICITL
jgi:hypothetical protein